MARLILILLFTQGAVSGVLGASFVLDLSHSHTIEDLRKSGLPIREIAGGGDVRSYLFSSQEVEVMLPGGKRISQSVELGVVDTRDGKVLRLFTKGAAMPHEQAVEVARGFHAGFGLPVSALEKWDVQIRAGTRGMEGYSVSPLQGYYPLVSVAFNSSLNGLYPWVICFEADWGWREQVGWDEARAWRELSFSPSAGISLNPPSGLKYDRRDAYQAVLKAQADYEKKVAQRQGVGASAEKRDAKQETDASPVHSDRESPGAYLWAFPAIVVLIAGGLFVKRLSRK